LFKPPVAKTKVLDMAPFPGIINQLPGGKLITLSTSIMEEATLCIYGMYTYSGNGITFPESYVLPKVLYVDFQNTLYTIMVLRIMVTFFTSRRNVTMDPCSWNSLILLCSSSSCISCLDSIVEWLFEDSVTLPAR
jgi:hypothetical protein